MSFHIDEYVEPEVVPIAYEPKYIAEPARSKVRKEVHTRTIFAHDMAVLYFKRMIHRLRDGNICSSKDTRRFLQARRIYTHYTNEYQACQNLPLTT